MFKTLQNISIRYKITIFVTFVCFITLATGFTFALKNDINILRKDFQDLAQARALLIGEYAIAPLSFHDKKGCVEILEKASTSLDFHSAELYDDKGNLFAHYGKIEERIPEHVKLTIDTAMYLPNNEEIRFSHIITHGKHHFGYLILHTSTEKLNEEIKRDIKALALSAFVIIMLGAILSFYSQRAVSNPIFKLESYLNHVTEDSNISKTVQVSRKDEIGKIYVAINKLLNKLKSKSEERDNLFSVINANNQKLGSTLEAFSDGYWEYDLTKNKWFFSDLWINTFGYTRVNIFTTNEEWENAIHLEDLNNYQNQIQKHLDGKSPFLDVEFRMLAKKGGYKWVHFKGKYYEQSTTKKPVILGITIDTNETKSNESLINMVNKRDVNNQKLTALAHLASGVSHRLKNTLNPIYGYAEFGQLTLKNNDLLHRELELIKQAAVNANSIVEDLLAFASEENLEIKNRIDLKSILDTLILDIDKKNKDIDIFLQSDLIKASILGDQSKITHALTHIITNSIDASLDKNSITITLKYQLIEQTKKFIHQEIPFGEYVYINIQDKGRGIDEEILEKIYEPFFTTKEIGQGIGLGLSVARGIIKAHKGYIYINNNPQIGVCTEIFLPVI